MYASSERVWAELAYSRIWGDIIEHSENILNTLTSFQSIYVFRPGQYRSCIMLCRVGIHSDCFFRREALYCDNKVVDSSTCSADNRELFGV